MAPRSRKKRQLPEGPQEAYYKAEAELLGPARCAPVLYATRRRRRGGFEPTVFPRRGLTCLPWAHWSEEARFPPLPYVLALTTLSRVEDIVLMRPTTVALNV